LVIDLQHIVEQCIVSTNIVENTIPNVINFDQQPRSVILVCNNNIDIV
jgi:hypothetical protein